MTSNKSQPDDENLLDQRTAAARSGRRQTARGGDTVNYRRPDPAGRAGWGSGQVRHAPGRAQDRQAVFTRPLTQAARPSRNRRGLHPAGCVPRRRSTGVQRGDNKQNLLTGSQSRLRRSPPVTPFAPHALPPNGAPQASRAAAATASARLRGCGSGRAGRAPVPPPAAATPAQPPLRGGQLPGAACSAPRVPPQKR